MVEGRKKSTTFRKLKTRVPSGRLVTHYHRRKPGKAQCSACGDYLKGVPRGISNTIKNTPKTQKRPERPYGGLFCSKCTRKLIKSKVRSITSLS